MCTKRLFFFWISIFLTVCLFATTSSLNSGIWPWPPADRLRASFMSFPTQKSPPDLEIIPIQTKQYFRALLDTHSLGFSKRKLFICSKAFWIDSDLLLMKTSISWIRQSTGDVSARIAEETDLLLFALSPPFDVPYYWANKQLMQTADWYWNRTCKDFWLLGFLTLKRKSYFCIFGGNSCNELWSRSSYQDSGEEITLRAEYLLVCSSSDKSVRIVQMPGTK